MRKLNEPLIKADLHALTFPWDVARERDGKQGCTVADEKTKRPAAVTLCVRAVMRLRNYVIRS